MARKYFNNVRHVIATAGTGAITLGTVPAGWQGFSAAGAIDGDNPPYELREGDNWEIGYLTLADSVTTATRTVLESSNSDTAIDLQGAAVLTCALLADTFTGDVPSFKLTQAPSAADKAKLQKNASQATVAKSSGFTVGVDDRGVTFICTGTFTVAFTAAATLTNGFECAFVNISGVQTLDPDGSELIDGAASVALNAGESCKVVCNGSAFRSERGRGAVPYDRAITIPTADKAVAQKNIAQATVAKSSGFTVGLDDRGVTFVCTGTFTVAFTAAATLTNGFECTFVNISGVQTLNPDGSELIDGAASIRVYPREGFDVCCNGTAFHTIGRGQTVTVATGPFGNVATFDIPIPDSGDLFQLEIIELKHATNAAQLTMLVSTDGSTFASGASDYTVNPSPSAGGGGVSASAITLSNASDNTNGAFTIDANVSIWPGDAGILGRVLSGCRCISSADSQETTRSLSGARLTGARFTHIRLAMTSGNISSGRYRLRELRSF